MSPTEKLRQMRKRMRGNEIKKTEEIQETREIKDTEAMKHSIGKRRSRDRSSGRRRRRLYFNNVQRRQRRDVDDVVIQLGSGRLDGGTDDLFKTEKHSRRM